MIDTPDRHRSIIAAGNAEAQRLRRRWGILAAGSVVLMLGVLAYAPTKEWARTWRKVHAQYRDLAIARGMTPSPPKIHQIWFPEVERADRCPTCHLGATAGTGATPLQAPRLFAAHPEVAHSPDEFGCTFCHAGQGRATETADAHGKGGSWPHPILPARHLEAGCGACHTGWSVPLPEEVEDAAEVLDTYACLGCHGAEGSRAPALDDIAARRIPADWVRRHRGLAPLQGENAPLDGLDEDEQRTASAWLRMRLGAPHLARGKSLFFGLGCLGCHRRGAVGGDVGPDLSAEGGKDVRKLHGEDPVPAEPVEGEEAEAGAAGGTEPGTGGAEAPSAGHDPGQRIDSDSLPSWLRAHFLAPQEVTPDSKMPPIDPEDLERESDLDDLVTYVLSLQDLRVPERLVPRDRARLEHHLGRDFPTTGRGLYVTFCSACHGPEGGGAELEALGLVTPMIGTRGFLAMVSRRYVEATVLQGRRGRIMPAFGPNDVGLSRGEMDRIVDHLFAQGFQARPFEAPAEAADPERGREVFGARCAGCHRKGGGQERFGLDLQAPGALRDFSRADLWSALQRGWVEEGMPSFAFLPDEDLHALIAFLRGASGGDSGPEGSAPPAPHDATAADPVEVGGARAYVGRGIWTSRCASCHGDLGQGGRKGPLLNTDAYLAWASDAYLARRIRGHRAPAARASVATPSPSDLASLVAYLRTWDGRIRPAASGTPDPDAVRRGRKAYASRCAECHGAGGEGRTAPSLALPSFRENVSRAFLVMTILEGRKGTAMRAWATADKNPVSVRQAWDLADFILTLGAESTRRPTEGQRTQPNDDQGE